MASDWQKDAAAIIKEALDQAGIAVSRPFCWFSLYTLYTPKMDADAPQKLVADAIRDALGIDDTHLSCFGGNKIHCPKTEQGIDVSLFGRPVRDDREFNQLSQAASDEILLTFDALCR